MFRKIIASFLCAAMLLPFSLQASTTYARENPKTLGGKAEFVEVIASDKSPDIYRSPFKGSKAYNNEEDVNNSYYIYNQLNDAERRLWDMLDRVADDLLVNSTNMTPYDHEGKTLYISKSVGMQGLSNEKASRILEIFRYSNPQYYFLFPGYVIFNDNQISLVSYSDFANGSKRSEITKEFKQKASQMLEKAKSVASTQEELVRAIQEIICYTAYYDEDYKPGGRLPVDSYLNQSAYSVFFGGETVCAGYSMAFEYLCNEAGIDCYAVTSLEHEWNRVRLDDNWYNIDLTWADVDTSDLVNYSYYLKSDRTYIDGETDIEKKEFHTLESFWNDYVDPCINDSSIVNKTIVLPVIDKMASMPIIERVNGAFTLSTQTEGAKIYYTTDGQDPSSSYSKSKLYTGKSISASNVKAIATAPGYFDSLIASSQDIFDASENQNTVKKLKAPSVKKITIDHTNWIDIVFDKRDGTDGIEYELYRNNKKIETSSTGIDKATSFNAYPRGVYKIRGRSYVFTENGSKEFSSWSSFKYAISDVNVNFDATKRSIRSNSITIKWDKILGVTEYTIYVSTKKTSGYKKVGSTNKTSFKLNSYNGKTLNLNKKHYIKIVASYTKGKVKAKSKATLFWVKW